MYERVLASLGWERKVTELAAEITNQVGRSAWFIELFRSELHVYGLALANARLRIEQANGVQNSERQLAQVEWSAADVHRASLRSAHYRSRTDRHRAHTNSSRRQRASRRDLH